METVGELCQTKKTLKSTQESIDYEPPNAPASSDRGQLFIFEDTEAVIKMIIKGRSPHMSHVSRTHRVDLDWLLTEFKLNSNIRVKYVHTTLWLRSQEFWTQLTQLFCQVTHHTHGSSLSLVGACKRRLFSQRRSPVESLHFRFLGRKAIISQRLFPRQVS